MYYIKRRLKYVRIYWIRSKRVFCKVSATNISQYLYMYWLDCLTFLSSCFHLNCALAIFIFHHFAKLFSMAAYTFFCKLYRLFVFRAPIYSKFFVDIFLHTVIKAVFFWYFVLFMFQDFSFFFITSLPSHVRCKHLVAIVSRGFANAPPKAVMYYISI